MQHPTNSVKQEPVALPASTDCPCFCTHTTQPVHTARTRASLFSNATYSRKIQSKKWVEAPDS